MYEYQICNVEDDDIFYKQCRALEKNIPNIVKKKFIAADILLQEYTVGDSEITVINEWTDGVYIKSEIDLTQFFKK